MILRDLAVTVVDKNKRQDHGQNNSPQKDKMLTPPPFVQLLLDTINKGLYPPLTMSVEALQYCMQPVLAISFQNDPTTSRLVGDSVFRGLKEHVEWFKNYDSVKEHLTAKLHTINADGTVVGQCWKNNGKVIFFHINHDKQGRGYGSAFVQFMEKEVLDKGGNFILIHAIASSQRFYEKLGYHTLIHLTSPANEDEFLMVRYVSSAPYSSRPQITLGPPRADVLAKEFASFVRAKKKRSIE